MGQEQSASEPASATGVETATTPGVLLVPGSGSGIGKATQTELSLRCDALLDQSSKLPLPQPLQRSSAPTAIDDTFAAGLKGTKVMHDLRTMLNDLSISTLPNLPALVTAPTAPQVKGHSGKNEAGFDRIIAGCTGAETVDKVLRQQEKLVERIVRISSLAKTAKYAVAQQAEQAAKVESVVESLDRFALTLADIHDHLETVIESADKVGAEYFEEDDEMSSFRSYLRHNPIVQN